MFKGDDLPPQAPLLAADLWPWKSMVTVRPSVRNLRVILLVMKKKSPESMIGCLSKELEIAELLVNYTDSPK